MICNGRIAFAKTAKVVAVALAAAISGGAVAAVQTNTWIAGSTDWSLASSYQENRTLNAGDVVVIPSGVTATVSVVSTEAANAAGSSFDVFSKLGRVLTQDAKSAIALDVAEGVSVTNFCYLVGKSSGQGTIIKRGPGMIEFGKGDWSYGYNLNLLVEEGILVLPQNIEGTDGCYVGIVTVNEGATLITAEDAEHKTGLTNGHTVMYELWGGGVVSNRWGSNRLNFRSAGRRCEFSGMLGKGMRLNVNAKMTLLLTGESNVVSPEMAGGVTIGFKKFGMSGELSSMGKDGVTYRTSAGTVLYLGKGEECNKNFMSWNNTDTDHVIDAGETGGLKLTGTIGCSTPSNLKETHGMKRLVLAGDNTDPCEFSGTLPTWTIWTTNYNWHVTKKGTGTWRFTDKAQTHAGGWTVEDGTLQFGSLKERGTACSLGTSTNLMENYGGLINESKRVDWAFALGGAATRGTMEYVGTNAVTCSTRPMLLKGLGGTIASSSNAVFRFYGVSAAAGADATLTLAGDATAVTNVVGCVCDGKGKVSLVKDGDGTWTLGGPSNTFSGTLSVKSGTLCVQDTTAPYTWFRWTVKEKFKTTEGGHVQAMELGIYDGDGKRINGGLYPFTNYYGKAEGTLPEGMCSYWRGGTVQDWVDRNYRPIEALFDDGTPLVPGRAAYMMIIFKVGGNGVIPVPETPSTWLPVVMHLTNGISQAASFDVVSVGDDNRTFKTIGMEGSLDGIHWDSLTNVTFEADVGKNKWCFSKGSYTSGSAGTHTGGCPIDGAPVNATPALANVESVSVAAGARLVALGGAAPIKGLVVDAAGAGTIENFAFAESDGTLDVKGITSHGGELPGSYVNCTGLSNLANWNLTVGGESTKKLRIAVRGSTVNIVPIGTVMVLR